jgi:hypothetical protein
VLIKNLAAQRVNITDENHIACNKYMQRFRGGRLDLRLGGAAPPQRFSAAANIKRIGSLSECRVSPCGSS